MSLITESLLVRCGGLPAGAALYAAPLAASFDARGIVSALACSTALANIMNESAALTRVEEDLSYSTAARLHAVYPSRFPTVASAQPYVNNPAKLATFVYGGWQGRGLGQLTGAENNAAYAKAKGIPLNQVADYLLTPEGAADSAAWFFVQRGCLPYGNRGDLVSVTRMWEGSTIGLKCVETWYAQITHAMGSPAGPALHAGMGTTVKAVAPMTADDLNAASLAGTLSI
jgi:putative chitinase